MKTVRGMSRTPSVFTAVLVALFLSVLTAVPVAAQYGGITGLLVTTDPNNPGLGDFSGLGCPAGTEVVLYFPGLVPTASDPATTQSVPGRVIAVTTSISSPNGLLDGTFNFPDITLPDDLEPGLYEIHSRCGDLDLSVIVELHTDGSITVEVPAPGGPGSSGDPNGTGDNPPGTLPFTGRESSRIIALSAGFIAAGIASLSLSRRRQLS